MTLLKLKWMAFLMLVSSPILAQSGNEFYSAVKGKPSQHIGFRLGSNYSFPTVTAYVDKQNNTTLLGGVVPRFGYYAGGFVARDLVANQVSFRLDATLQMKGVGAEYLGRTTVKASYYYFGLSPQIGLYLTPHLLVYLGAEANVLINKVHPWGETYPLEIGSLLRFTYTVGRYGLEVGYFKGYTKFDSFGATNLPGGPTSNDFYNQSVQLGLSYQWSH